MAQLRLNKNLKALEKEVSEKDKRYRSLFERSIDPIFLTTTQFTLVNVNQAFIDFTGYADEECLAFPINKLFAQDEDYQHFIRILEEKRQVRDYEATFMSKSGERKECLINCIFIPHDIPEVASYQGIIQDLTLRKQAEADMLQAERLSLTGKIARTIAHEVRNPLTSLNLALDQLREEIPAENKSAKRYSAIIARSARRIEQLVDEMLSSSKPKQLCLALHNVDEIMTDSVSLALDRLKLNQIKLQMTYEANIPRILVDKDKIQIALLNIIINAIEAMVPGEGILRIESSLKDKIITIAITDNGKGISSGDRERLFDPFFTNKHNGMGLGLTSTQSILTSHSAQVHVKSEVNKGTTFYVNFKVS